MNINIIIERLILDGLPIHHSQGELVKASVESELARLFSEGGATSNLTSGGAVPAIPPCTIQLDTGFSPQRAGEQIAKAIYGSISHE